MNYLPSKELLSEVLGHKVWKVLGCNMGTLRYCIYPNKGDEPSEYIFPINIYKLAHKCKEWAKNKGYVIGTDLDKVNVWSIKERIIINHFEVYFEDYLEFEIKACQWILENKD